MGALSSLFTLSTAISLVIIVLVSLASELSGPLAALVASAPSGAPLAIYIYWSKSGHSQQALVDFTAELVKGVFATLCFCIAASLGKVGTSHSSRHATHSQPLNLQTVTGRSLPSTARVLLQRRAAVMVSGCSCSWVTAPGAWCSTC